MVICVTVLCFRKVIFSAFFDIYLNVSLYLVNGSLVEYFFFKNLEYNL